MTVVPQVAVVYHITTPEGVFLETNSHQLALNADSEVALWLAKHVVAPDAIPASEEGEETQTGALTGETFL
jgi:hypothetical protein